MADFKALLKQHAEGVKAAQEAGAISKESVIMDASAPSNMATGIQGSQEAISMNAPEAPIFQGVLDEERAAKALGAYAATDLNHFYDESGVKIKPTDGYFYAESEGHAVMLEHYAKSGKVEKQEVKK